MNLPDLSPLSGHNVLVTGATGMIGSMLVQTLMEQSARWGYSVYALGRNAERARALFSEYGSRKEFHFIRHDITDQLDVPVDFHYIFHLASGAAPQAMRDDPVGIMKANFIGTDNLLSYGMKHNMKRFLLVSSGEVYGEGVNGAFSETDSGYVDSMRPRSCYPSSKRAAETLCAAYMAQFGADVVVARPCHVYGASFTESDNRAYAQFIRNVVHGEDIVLNSSGTQYRSWLYVEDCVSALLYILLKGERGEAYNVADENSCLTIRELAETIAKIGGRQVVVAGDTGNDSGNSNITRAVFNTEKLRKLGWQPKHTYQEVLSEIIKQKRTPYRNV